MATPLNDNQSYFEPQTINRTEAERLSKLQLARRRSSFACQSPAPSAQGGRKERDDNADDDSVMIGSHKSRMSPHKPGHLKQAPFPCEIQIKEPSIFNADLEHVTLRASKDSAALQKDVDKKGKQDGKIYSSQRSLKNKLSDDEATKSGPTPAERYL